MKKVFVDANIILDVILKRKEFFLESSNVIDLAPAGDVEMYATVLTFANALYVCRPIVGKSNAIVKLKEMFCYLHIAPLGQEEYEAATLMSPKDMEDDFQYCAAVSAGCEVLVTRNVKDFPQNAKIAIMKPRDFLDSLVAEKKAETSEKENEG